MPARSTIIGISAFYHDSACAVIVDGQLRAAAAEERFSRLKHDRRLPIQSFRYCLQAAGIGIQDLNCLGYYESPTRKRERQVAADTNANPPSPRAVTSAIREGLGFEGPIVICDHHQSHAASTFHFSGFDEAAILIVDGVGEWATTSYWQGSETGLECLREIRFPHSLGLLYAALTAFLGFRVNRDELKVMGLAAYGRPTFQKQFSQLIRSSSPGDFELVMDYFDFVSGRRMFSEGLADLLGVRPRTPAQPITTTHYDLASSLQATLETALLEQVEYLSRMVDSENLCLAGGVAMNCVANGRLQRDSRFRRIFIQPASGDAGSSLGAAALAYRHFTGAPFRGELLDDALGPGFERGQILPVLDDSGLEFVDFEDRWPELLELVVERLIAGEIIGWFSGRMEFGPRALGRRSILASPLLPTIKDRLNAQIKRRESFRPFAPVVLEAEIDRHFDLGPPSRFMLRTCQVTSELDLPAITHVDGSARPQTLVPEHHPRLGDVLALFAQRTGCPMLLNTSFNVAGEPIVCTPADALACFANAQLDLLVLEDFLVERNEQIEILQQISEQWRLGNRSTLEATNPLGENLYSFV